MLCIEVLGESPEAVINSGIFTIDDQVKSWEGDAEEIAQQVRAFAMSATRSVPWVPPEGIPEYCQIWPQNWKTKQDKTTTKLGREYEISVKQNTPKSLALAHTYTWATVFSLGHSSLMSVGVGAVWHWPLQLKDAV